jgi:hypothetical protein
MTTVAIVLAGGLTSERVAKPGAWITYVVAGLVLLGAMCATYYLCYVLDRRAQDGRDSGDGDDEGGGGTHRGRGPTPPKDSPGTDPEWWPEFERQFAHHVGCRVHAGPAPNTAAGDAFSSGLGEEMQRVPPLASVRLRPSANGRPQHAMTSTDTSPAAPRVLFVYFTYTQQSLKVAETMADVLRARG